MAASRCSHCNAEIDENENIVKVGRSQDTLNNPHSLYCDNTGAQKALHNFVEGSFTWQQYLAANAQPEPLFGTEPFMEIYSANR